MWRTGLNTLITLLTTISLWVPAFAQDPVKQDPPARPRQTKPLKPAPQPDDKQVQTTPVIEPEDQMRSALTNLSTQIGLLTDEMRKLRKETERNSGMMELLLNEDRLTKIEATIQEANDHKAQLDAREQEYLRRQKNIQGELLLRGGLRRDEAEAAIRNELQRGLEDVRGQQVIYQQRIAELNDQANRLRTRVEKLRKKLEAVDSKDEKEEK